MYGPENMLEPLGIDRPTLLEKIKGGKEPLLPNEKQFIDLGNIQCGALRLRTVHALHRTHRAVHRAAVSQSVSAPRQCALTFATALATALGRGAAHRMEGRASRRVSNTRLLCRSPSPSPCPNPNQAIMVGVRQASSLCGTRSSSSC